MKTPPPSSPIFATALRGSRSTRTRGGVIHDDESILVNHGGRDGGFHGPHDPGAHGRERRCGFHGHARGGDGGERIHRDHGMGGEPAGFDVRLECGVCGCGDGVDNLAGARE